MEIVLSLMFTDLRYFSEATTGNTFAVRGATSKGELMPKDSLFLFFLA